MPRNVRNFWIELEVDGKATRIAAGPQAKDGGFSLSVKMRNGGEIVRALHVSGFAGHDGLLVLQSDPLIAADDPSLAPDDRGGFEYRALR